MPHAVRVALLVCLLLPAASWATPTLVQFAGSVLVVSDSFGMLDGSIVDGSEPGNPPPTTLSGGTYRLDPTSADTSTPFGVGFAQISFALGSYLFEASHASHTIALQDDTGAPGFEVDRWQSREIVMSDLDPGTSNHPADFGGFAAQFEFFDFGRTTFDGTESAVFLPALGAPWDQARLTLNSVDSSGAFDGRVQIEMDITGWAVSEVPEPGSAALVALGLVSLALRARRQVSRSEP